MNMFYSFIKTLLITLILLSPLSLHAEDDPAQAALVKANLLYRNKNVAEAYELYKKIVTNQKAAFSTFQNAIDNSLNCLGRLGRQDEIDTLLGQAAKEQARHWQHLSHLAKVYFLHNVPHYGYIIAGQFKRGHHRGGGRMVNSYQRDRVRALQLLMQALAISKTGPENSDYSDLYYILADALYRNIEHNNQKWKFQHLSDLNTLPDYEQSHHHHYHYHDSLSSYGAPVDQAGEPILYTIPASFETAKSDGERWRWALNEYAKGSPHQHARAELKYADFLKAQFGVQTLSSNQYFLSETAKKLDTQEGIFSVHTLAEDETIATLATGIKRFKFHPQHNYISLYKKIADNKLSSSTAAEAFKHLAETFENRRQYKKAVSYWEKVLSIRGPSSNASKRIQQITGNFGEFEATKQLPAGKKAALYFTFRNGKKVSFSAHRIKTKKLLEDVQDYISSSRSQLEWEKIHLSNLAYRLVNEELDDYLGERVAKWSLDLKPRDNHFDKRIEVKTPLEKAGAYLLTARMASGNTSQIILWLNDAIISKRPMSTGNYFFIADAQSGRPLSDVDVEFFGYRVEHTYTKFGKAKVDILKSKFSKATDENGTIFVDSAKMNSNYQWLVIANTKDNTTYYGFEHYSYRSYVDPEYNQVKVFAITDRPVYRPKQNVKFKLWIRNAKYDVSDKSAFAYGNYKLKIDNPKGEKVFEKVFETDAYGGLSGEFSLKDDAALGAYQMYLEGYRQHFTFRVEEYKKPEFEVKIDTPKKPQLLGDVIKATIKANYLFGAPVVNAKVKYKVLRYNHETTWYPTTPWDWLYGIGYWWFGLDYDWYPGWVKWACKSPRPYWHHHTPAPPEVVQNNEVQIGHDGKVNIEIDTSIAKELYGKQDHRYEITAEVVDASRRTIVGTGSVIIATQPYKVYAWVDRGYYQSGDTIKAHFNARTPDGSGVQGQGQLQLIKISYNKARKASEEVVQSWDLDTDLEGRASLQVKAAKPGQYRLSYTLTNSSTAIEGGYIFSVIGKMSNSPSYRFNALEVIPDKQSYTPGDKVKLLINTEQENSTVILFVRPVNGVYPKAQVIRMNGKSAIREVAVSLKDMPNFFVEAFTIYDGDVHLVKREIVVPPQERVLKVEVKSKHKDYKPGQEASLEVFVKDPDNNPYQGALAISVYDKAVEYISGGSNVAEIKSFFWKWRRHHSIMNMTSVLRRSANIVRKNEERMVGIGVFGHIKALAQVEQEEGRLEKSEMFAADAVKGFGLGGKQKLMRSAGAPVALEEKSRARPTSTTQTKQATPTVRKNFADTAFWIGALETDKNGYAKVTFRMPESLTTWKVRTWAVSHGTKVGEESIEVITSKKLLLRLQAPRFFVEKDEVVLSANIHNYLKHDKQVEALLEIEGDLIKVSKASQKVLVPAGGEKRVDWRVLVKKEGQAVITMKALSDEESDAMQMTFPVFVHGMLKTDSYSGAIAKDEKHSQITVTVPKERRAEQTKLEIRYSPSLAYAMIDALPYLVSYPYDCTEQTLSRFLPTVIVQRLLQKMGINLAEIKEKRVNFNAQEIGDKKARTKQWQRYDHNPVFDEREVTKMVKAGIERLSNMQLSDGGWGWFSGWGEHPSPHTTAYVMHGLHIAKQNDLNVDPNVYARGANWLKNYQAQQVQKLKNALKNTTPAKEHTDNLDAFIFMVLDEAKVVNEEMRSFLYRDRGKVSVYAMAMFALALYRQERQEEFDMLMRNIKQFLVHDDENQSAYLKMPQSYSWWYWHGSEVEANAYYLKLLALVDPQSKAASGIAKYLINNRKNSTYWNSTRDTALAIEALAEYVVNSGEAAPNMKVSILIDGKKEKQVTINSDNLFYFDDTLILKGKELAAGKHVVEFKKQGQGPLYYNAYMTNFTLEDYIKKAGLEIKVERAYYLLKEVDKSRIAAGGHGQVVDQKVQKYERSPIKNLDTLKSGDLVEIELKIISKNDYEYLVFEDMKAAGFEPVDLRSGYNGNEMGAYVEFRDEKVNFFVTSLARGTHSLSYRMRAEIPGKFSALPTKAYAMYAPELRANSDEIKLKVVD